MITVLPHAYKRAIQRFAIMPKEANRWINDRLSESVFVETQEDGRKRFAHPELPVFIVTCPKEENIISIVDKPTERVVVNSVFLDAIMPKIEREYEKMKRTYRIQRRGLERSIAEAVTAMGITLEKRARVYNPKTQELLEAQADEMQAKIDAMKAELDDLKQQYNVASLKMRAFIRTSSGDGN